MEIRALDEGDVEALWALRLRGLASDPEAFGSTYDEALEAGAERYRERLRETSERAFYLGAWDSDELAGMVRFAREEGAKDSHKGEVSGLYVAPSWRGKGIGRAMMVELVARARRMPGLEQLHLSVVTTNAAADVLYRSLGFVVYGMTPHALKDGDRYWDEHLMVLFLASL